MRDDPDLPLILRIAAGDREALETLYSRHGLWLLNVLISRCADRASAEDALQEVMVAVWQGAGKFRGDSQVTTWLYGIAQRQSLHSFRPTTASWDERLPGEDGDFASDAILRDRLREALSRLPPAEQEALELVYYRELSLAEAAQHSRIPLNTLKSRLIRARKRLRQWLKKEMNDAP